MGEVQFTFLGGFEVLLDGAPVVGFISSKARALLCYLAVEGCEQSRENLAALLWGDMPHVKALISLRQALANLRRLLGEYIVVTRHTAALHRHSAYRLDVAEFAAAVTRFHQRADTQAGQQADALYRGDFLQGFHVRDAQAFDEWMRAQREWLHSLGAELFDDLAAYYARQGEYALTLRNLDRLLSLEPWREEAHRQRMLVLTRLNRRSAALKQYATCRRVLAAEFGVAPSAETTALYNRVLRARRVPLSEACRLPAPLTAFVGRAAELARLHALLADPTARLIALTGPEGVGKSRLAIEAVRRARAMFLDGVCYVSLEHLSSAEQLPAALAEALALDIGDDPLAVILAHLRDRELLLLLDGFERLLPAPVIGVCDNAVWPDTDEENPGAPVCSLWQRADYQFALQFSFVAENNDADTEESHGADLLDILKAAPQVKLLIVSQQPVGLREEHCFLVNGLAYPPPTFAGVSEADLEAYDAALLFLRQVRRARPDFAPTAEEVSVIAHLCRMVEGLPLALEQAAYRYVSDTL